MMLYHTSCKGEVKAALVPPGANLVSSFSLTPLGVVPIKGDIIFESKNSKIPINYYCTQCKTVIKPEEVSGRCNQCGREFPSTNLYLSNKSSIVTCGTDVPKNEEVTGLRTVLSSLIID